MTDTILNDIINLLSNRIPTNMIIDELNLLQYGNSKKQIRRLINNIYCGIVFYYEDGVDELQNTKINTPRPITYTDDDIRFICDKLEKGYRNYEIVNMLYERLGFDGNIKTTRRYKSLVSNIKNKVHRVDISKEYKI